MTREDFVSGTTNLSVQDIVKWIMDKALPGDYIAAPGSFYVYPRKHFQA